MSDEEDNNNELQHLGKPKKKISDKQLEAGKNNLKKGPKQISQNAIEKVESENIPYNLNNYYSSIEKYLNQTPQIQKVEENEKPKKKVVNNDNKKLIERLNILETHVKSTNEVMTEILNHKKQKLEKNKELKEVKKIESNVVTKKENIDKSKVSNIEKFLLLQKSLKKI